MAGQRINRKGTSDRIGRYAEYREVESLDGAADGDLRPFFGERTVEGEFHSQGRVPVDQPATEGPLFQRGLQRNASEIVPAERKVPDVGFEMCFGSGGQRVETASPHVDAHIGAAQRIVGQEVAQRE